jgi:hypothetical protein
MRLRRGRAMQRHELAAFRLGQHWIGALAFLWCYARLQWCARVRHGLVAHAAKGWGYRGRGSSVRVLVIWRLACTAGRR